MKKLISIFVALCMVCALCAACGSKEAASASEPAAAVEPAAPAEKAEPAAEESSEETLELPVTIENKTGVDIHQLYATSANLEAWGEDILGSEVLTDGSTADTTFVIGADDLKWDLKMVDSEGTEIELYGLDFSDCSTDGGTVVLEFDGTNGTATLYSTDAAEQTDAQVLELPVTIENKTGVDIHQLFTTSANLEAWGDDVLGDEVLADGSSVDTSFVIGADDLKWDLMMVDSEGTQIELYGLDFSDCSTDGGTVVLEFDGTNGTATLISK